MAKKVENYLYMGVKWTAVLMFLLMVSLCILQVICRYVLKLSLSFTEELSRFLFIWVTFLGTAMALKKHQHVKMDLLVSVFPARIRKAVEQSVGAFTVFIYGILIYSGIGVMEKTMDQTSAAMNFPMGLVYAAVPVSFAVMILFQICEWMNRREEER